MIRFLKFAGSTPRVRWLAAAACAAGLVMAPFVVAGQTADPLGAASDRQAINSSLVAERLLVQFYNQNMNKGYLQGTPVETPPGTTTTGTTTTGDTTTGATTTGDTTTGTTTTGDTTTGATTTGTTTTGDTTTGATTTGDTSTGSTTTGTSAASDNVNALRSMASEFLSHHQSHVASLEQGLGTDAQPAPTFLADRLEAPTADQFLTMAIMLEDFATSVHQQSILTGFNTLSGPVGGTTTGTTTTGDTTTGATTTGTTTTGDTTTGATTTGDTTTGSTTTGTTTTGDTTTGATTTGGTTTTGTTTTGGAEPMNFNAISTLLGIALDDARHAGALRGYRKTVSTAEGGNPDQMITDEGALNVPRTAEQINQFLQPFIDTGTGSTTTGTTTTGTTTTGDTTTGSTTTGDTTTGTTTTGGTTTGDTTTGTTTTGDTTTGTTTTGDTTTGTTTVGTTTTGTL